ncbi:MAG: hypothetical protein HUU41_02530 [Bryobacteraceae bacterium]|nr:hypothetical protein [Bryobacteraceae bacterium]
MLQCAAKQGWDLVISLKRNLPELHASAVRLFAHRLPDVEITETMRGKTYRGQIWDTPGLPLSTADPQLVRVVRSEEQLTQNHYRREQIQPETTEHEWMWITTLEPQAFPAKTVRELGHDRWKQENNGWNDLTQNWSLKHGFLHACRHRPRAAASQDQPVANAAATETSNPSAPSANPGDPLVPNHGLAAVVLILMLAFTLCAAFTRCHSKLVRRYHLTGIEVARQLRVSVAKLPRIRAPDSPAPQPATI